jgi:hypothetical protein
MKITRPDIIVMSPEDEYLMIVEVKLQNISTGSQYAIEQLKQTMASMGCSVGLLVAGDRVILLRDSLEESNGKSIYIVGEAMLPTSLLPPADSQGEIESEFRFESQVQQWLEKLKLASSRENLPNDLKKLLSEPIINLLRLGEVRAAHPRWSETTK